MIIKKINSKYSISEYGDVYRNGGKIKPILRKDKGTLIVFIGKRKALATLVAEHFLPKSKNKNLIFKDKNRINVHYSNLMWLDNFNYRTYCGLHLTKKKIGCRLKASLMAKCEYLKKYYLTLDDEYLFQSWEIVKQRLSYKFDNYLDEMYLYFIDRSTRFTLIGDPAGLMLCYKKFIDCKNYKHKLFNENLSRHNK